MIPAARFRCTATAAGWARSASASFADGTYGSGWNGVGAASYLGHAGQGVTGLIHGDTRQFWCQLMGATLYAVWAFGATFVVFWVVNKVKSMRVRPKSRKKKAGRSRVRHAGLSGRCGGHGSLLTVRIAECAHHPRTSMSILRPGSPVAAGDPLHHDAHQRWRASVVGCSSRAFSSEGA